MKMGTPKTPIHLMKTEAAKKLVAEQVAAARLTRGV